MAAIDQDNLINSDDDLEKKAKKTNFNISRIFKYFLLFLSIGLILLLAVLFVAALCTSRSFRDAVNDEIKDNIIGIIITGLAVIGIQLGMIRGK